MALPQTQPGKFDRNKRPAQHPDPIGRLSGHFHASPKIYFASLLTESMAVTGALAGQIWALNEIGQLARIGSTNPKRFQAFESDAVVQRHRSLLSQIISSGTPSATPFRDASQNGRERVIYLAPLHLENETVGVVELILDRPLDASSETGLQQLVAEASRYLTHRATHIDDEPLLDGNQPSKTKPADTAQLEQFSPETEFNARFPNGFAAMRRTTESHSIEPDLNPSGAVRDFEEFVLLLHNQSDLDYVASTSVNETRRLVRCDRVWLATMSRGTCNINAISGQDDIVRKTNTVRAMQKLAEYVIKTGLEINFALGAESLTDESFALTAEYLDSSGASWLKAVPLFAPEKIDFDSSIHVSDRIAFAALVIELFTDKPVPVAQSIQRLTSHISLAAWHALKQDELFLLTVRRRIGQWSRTAKLTRTRTLIGAGAMILFTSVLTFVKAPYHVSAMGRLMPVKQFRAYAPFDGQVEDVWVNSDEAVQPNQKLINVHGESLITRALILANSVAEKEKILSAYKAQLDDNSNQHSPNDRISLSAKIAQYTLEIDGLAEQLELTHRLVERSQVKSPIAGTVATFQPGDLLNGRPVARGELLLEVMDENGPWQLELQIPEKRLDHLLRQDQSLQRKYPVTFVPATTPENTYQATFTRIANRVSISDTGASSILVFANIKPDPTLQRTIGAEVTARIQCGERSLGYVWFGDILDWARSNLW